MHIKNDEIAPDVGPPPRLSTKAWVSSIEMNKIMVEFRKTEFVGGITMRQARMLSRLSRIDHAPTLTEMAELSQAGSTQGCKRLMNCLENAGLLRVVKNKKDCRSICFEITEQGRELGTLYEAFAEMVSDLLDDRFSSKELEAAIQVLVALSEIMTVEINQKKQSKQIIICDPGK